MKKLEKDLYIKHAKRLQAIVDEKSTFINFLTRDDFKKVIQNQLNILNACEKLFPKVELDAKFTARALAKTFNKITKDKFKINDNFNYEDETDLIDGINYLFTFCNNMFKVNLDDLIEGKNVTATDPKIDLRAKPQFDDVGPRMNSNFAFAGTGIPLAATPYENPYFIGKAYAKLTDDMKEGRFYRFKTKPTIIPKIKWLAIILLGLVAISLIIASIFIFISTSLKIVVEGEAISIGSGYATIGSGVLYIILAAFTAYPMYVLIKGLIGKDQNQKYYFNWTYIMIFVLLAMIVVMPDMRVTWLMPYEIQPDQNTVLMAYKMWKILYIVSLSLSGLTLIPMILGSIFNPKPDPEAVEKKIREYVDLFSAESGQSPVPPKADMQKPIPVKEPKKGKYKK